MAVKKKTGRPLAKIDAEQVTKLAALQCTLEEIGAFFGVDKSTISKRFSTEVTKGKGQGKTRLRKYQWDMAQKSPAMAIWLGKQYLGQKEPERIEKIMDIPFNPEFTNWSDDKLIEYLKKE